MANRNRELYEAVRNGLFRILSSRHSGYVPEHPGSGCFSPDGPGSSCEAVLAAIQDYRDDVGLVNREFSERFAGLFHPDFPQDEWGRIAEAVLAEKLDPAGWGSSDLADLVDTVFVDHELLVARGIQETAGLGAVRKFLNSPRAVRAFRRFDGIYFLQSDRVMERQPALWRGDLDVLDVLEEGTDGRLQ